MAKQQGLYFLMLMQKSDEGPFQRWLALGYEAIIVDPGAFSATLSELGMPPLSHRMAGDGLATCAAISSAPSGPTYTSYW